MEAASFTCIYLERGGTRNPRFAELGSRLGHAARLMHKCKESPPPPERRRGCNAYLSCHHLWTSYSSASSPTAHTMAHARIPAAAMDASASTTEGTRLEREAEAPRGVGAVVAVDGV